MKLRLKIFAFIFSALVLFSSNTVNQDAEKNEVLAKLIMQGLNMSHYNPKSIDDNFSEEIFNSFIENLDYSKRFFIAGDIALLSSYKFQIDDELQNGTYQFFDLAIELLNKRIKNAENYYKQILINPFEYTSHEMAETDPEKLEFSKDTSDLKIRWQLALKLQVLERIIENIEVQENSENNKDTIIKVKTFTELESEARDKILKRHDDWFQRLHKLETRDRREAYLNVITNAFDPHTSYFAPENKENFDIAMSGRLEGIGASLQQQGSYIKISRIVPGSACWRQGELEEGDIILKVAQANEEPVDVVDMRMDDAINLIRGPKGTEVRLTVKKLDETIKVIPIIRDIVILDETYAKSAMINDPQRKINNIGYIRLPKFYMDMNQTGAQSCSEDIKNELMKLRSQGAEGIILDLRNNGGGSLSDVVKIAGYFIDQGPVVQIKSRTGEPQILSDNEPGQIYGGPLVILVNFFSASASEILAAAMQDYKRAVIIGSKSTFGKGTVQRFFELDQFLQGEASHIKPLGSIKLTTQKFYRITGASTQLKGVIPDIILPDRYTFIPIGEQEYKEAMPWDEIFSIPFQITINYEKKINKAILKSNNRVNENNGFKMMKENALYLKNRRDETNYSLNFDIFKTQQKEFKDQVKKLDSLKTVTDNFTLDFTNLDISQLQSDTSQSKTKNAWLDNLKNDMYLYEAVAVINDLK